MQKVYEVIEIDMEEEILDKLVAYGLEKIKNDRQALIEYAVNDVLTYVIEHEEEFKKIAEEHKKEKQDDTL